MDKVRAGPDPGLGSSIWVSSSRFRCCWPRPQIHSLSTHQPTFLLSVHLASHTDFCQKLSPKFKETLAVAFTGHPRAMTPSSHLKRLSLEAPVLLSGEPRNAFESSFHYDLLDASLPPPGLSMPLLLARDGHGHQPWAPAMRLHTPSLPPAVSSSTLLSRGWSCPHPLVPPCPPCPDAPPLPHSLILPPQI